MRAARLRKSAYYTCALAGRAAAFRVSTLPYCVLPTLNMQSTLHLHILDIGAHNVDKRRCEPSRQSVLDLPFQL
jgi:hypothetical protein